MNHPYAWYFQNSNSEIIEQRKPDYIRNIYGDFEYELLSSLRKEYNEYVEQYITLRKLAEQKKDFTLAKYWSSLVKENQSMMKALIIVSDIAFKFIGNIKRPPLDLSEQFLIIDSIIGSRRDRMITDNFITKNPACYCGASRFCDLTKTCETSFDSLHNNENGL